MEIWLIRNGEKSGPYPDYDINSRIRSGGIEKTTMVWYEGLAEWMPLGELEMFREEFEKEDFRSSMAEELPEEAEQAAYSKKVNPKPPPLPVAGAKVEAYFLRRFAARWFDLFVYAGVWWLAMYLAGRDIGAALASPWVLLSIYVPWFLLEAWLIHRFGRTPGKWLMGLSVVNPDGSEIPLKAAIWRSVRVMVTGVGFGWGMLAIFCQAISWFATKKLGKPVWDYLGGHEVKAEPVKVVRVVALVILLMGAMQLQAAVTGPYFTDEMMERFPAMRKYMEEGRKWHFPKQTSRSAQTSATSLTSYPTARR